MKVSVMITTYNLKDYVAQTLDSVLMQKTEFPFEILVGDDGSTDGTVEILKKYKDKYPEKIQLYSMPREDGKVYNRVERSAANRLNLLKQAKGQYCGFLDGDDYYVSEEKLQKQVDILEKEENRDCVMCAHNLLLHYEDGTELPLSRAKKERKLSLKQYWPLMFLQANAILFRNIWKMDPPTGILAKNFDDNNITYWLFQHGKMYYIPELLGAYRQVSGSSWNAIDKIQKASSNVLGYSVEMSINKENRKLSDIRHYPDFRCLYENRSKISKEACMPFYQTAKENEVKEALWIYELDEEDLVAVAKLKKRVRKGQIGYFRAKAIRSVKKLLGLY